MLRFRFILEEQDDSSGQSSPCASSLLRPEVAWEVLGTLGKQLYSAVLAATSLKLGKKIHLRICTLIINGMHSTRTTKR